MQQEFKGTYTYLLRNVFGLVKVGRSTDPESRRKAIEAASGVRTELIYYIEGRHLELSTQIKLKQYRKEGEWFKCTEKQAIDALNEANEEYTNSVAVSAAKMAQAIRSAKSGTLIDDPKLKELEAIRKAVEDGKLETLTETQISTLQRHMLHTLIEYAGNPSHLAKMLDVTSSTVYSWINRGKISKKGARQVQANRALKKHFDVVSLRPDMKDQ